MVTALVLHATADESLARDRLLPLLPSLGFEAWISSTVLESRHLSVTDAVQASAGVFVVVSEAAAASVELPPRVEEAFAACREDNTTLIPLLADGTAAEGVTEALASRSSVDLRGEAPELRDALSRLLPFDDLAEHVEPGRIGPNTAAEPLPWSDELFSATLVRGLERQDYSMADELIGAFERHARRREEPYSEAHALSDLLELRTRRKFDLMRRLGAAVLSTGTPGRDGVRQHYAHALIETRFYDEAADILQGLIDHPDASGNARVEAEGLMGRLHKQRYVDDPQGANAVGNIKRAFAAYSEGYEADPSAIWLGVNAMSCAVVAQRDGVPGADPGVARDLAERILARLEVVERESGELDEWDRASRVEALVVLKRFEEAEREVHAFLEHPRVNAFAVSSIYRQFTQVLGLGDDPRARGVIEPLKAAVERHRSESVLRPEPELDLGGFRSGKAAAPQTKPLLVRVADSSWEPSGIPDLEITARVGTVIAASGTDASVEELLHDLDVISVEESHPAGTEECHVSLPFIGAPTVWQETEERGSNVLVAVIDNGIDVLHEAFWDDQGRNRIVEIWDQGDDTGPPPDGFDLGTVHTVEDIAGYMRDGAVPDGLGRNPNGHGTHVASIAAGRPAGQFAGGVAPESKILFVRPASHEYIGYSVSHVQALDYIDGVARRLKLPVVVNVSQGMNAGAHDGKSALEVAFNEFSGGGRKRGRVIVKSAGNERHKGGHAKVTLAPRAVEKLRWYRDPGANFGLERIELWWSSADEMEFKLSDPSQEVTSWVAAEKEDKGSFESGNQYRISYTKRHVDNGDSRLLIEINEGSSHAIEAGPWELLIKSGEVPEGGEIHAWIERGSGIPTNFETHANEEMTISVPGTAESVITVGAVETMDDVVMVGGFSSYGPTRDNRQKPEVAAPGVNINAAAGGTASGARVSQGTSMAAPHVAGAIALLLSRNPRLTTTQIASALRQKTRDYNGRWDPGAGWGVLDVVKLIRAF